MQIPQLHLPQKFSGKAGPEQEITRQPAEERLKQGGVADTARGGRVRMRSPTLLG